MPCTPVKFIIATHIKRKKNRNQYNYHNQSEKTVQPTPSIYTLHNSQGQLSGFHDFMECLNRSRLWHFLRLSGSIVFQTIGPKLLNDLSPLLTVFTFGRKNDVPDLVSLPISQKISLIKGGESSCFTLYISIAT